MKKMLTIMTLLSSLLLANGSNEILEERIENELRIRNISIISTYNIDYDVDIYGNQMNLEIEFNGVKEPKLNYDEIASKIIDISRSIAPDIEDIYTVIKFDPMVGEDKILFSKTYFK